MSGIAQKTGMERTDPIAKNAASTNRERVMYQNPIRKKKINGYIIKMNKNAK